MPSDTTNVVRAWLVETPSRGVLPPEEVVPVPARNFTCNHCRKTFRDNSKLQDHVISHRPVGERKTIPCDLECGVLFCRQKDMLRHGENSCPNRQKDQHGENPCNSKAKKRIGDGTGSGSGSGSGSRTKRKRSSSSKSTTTSQLMWSKPAGGFVHARFNKPTISSISNADDDPNNNPIPEFALVESLVRYRVADQNQDVSGMAFEDVVDQGIIPPPVDRNNTEFHPHIPAEFPLDHAVNLKLVDGIFPPQEHGEVQFIDPRLLMLDVRADEE